MSPQFVIGTDVTHAVELPSIVHGFVSKIGCAFERLLLVRDQAKSLLLE